MIHIYEPDISKYKKSAYDAIESGWISNHGVYVSKSTELLKKILNVKNVILMNNGTSATICLFLSLKFKYPKINKIYVPDNVYVAAWNAALDVYSSENLEVLPIDENTWNVKDDDELINSLEQNSALLVVHNVGNIFNIHKVKRLRPDIVILEDNCEGIFGEYEGIKSGCSIESLCSCVSFYGNKTITTGEGGAFITNDDDVYQHISSVYSQGMSQKRYVHNVHAYNFRMTNIQAAFLYDQLQDLNSILMKKETVFSTYNLLFKNLIEENKVKIQSVSENTKRANWIYPIRIFNNKKSVDETNEYFKQNGIEIRPFFYPIDTHSHLKNIKKHSLHNQNVSQLLNNEIIMIPSSPLITYEQQYKIVECIKKFVNE